jgi:hypothetical protein
MLRSEKNFFRPSESLRRSAASARLLSALNGRDFPSRDRCAQKNRFTDAQHSRRLFVAVVENE